MNLVFFNAITSSRINTNNVPTYITTSKISYSLIKAQLLPCAIVSGYKFHALTVHQHPTFTTPPIRGRIWNPVKHLWWGLFYKYSQPVEAIGYFRGGAPSSILNRILNMILPNKLFLLVHTNTASLLPSTTPRTQGLTLLLGRKSKHKN